jgi:hypothetical protein
VAHECPRHGVPAFGLRACYDCVKHLAFSGERLTDAELDFVGMRPNGHKPAGGWHDPGNLGSYELDVGLSPEDSAMLSALMSHPSADQLEFLG